MTRITGSLSNRLGNLCRRCVKQSGTLIPISIVVAFLLSIGSSAATDLTWQRPAIYAITSVCLTLGLLGLLRMSRHRITRFPSVFIVTMIYQKLTLDLIYITLTINSTNLLYPQFFEIPQWVVWGMFIGCSITICVVNLILFFGPKRGWMEDQTDPIPGRSVLQNLRDRIR